MAEFCCTVQEPERCGFVYGAVNFLIARGGARRYIPTVATASRCCGPGDCDPGEAHPEASDGRARRASPHARSPIEITSTLTRGRWTVPILWSLFWGGKRFYRLLRDIEGVSRTSLETELQALEELTLVEREFRRDGSHGVEYRLSRLGESLKPLLATMYQWGLFARRLPVAEKLVPSRRASDPQAERPRPAD